MRVGNGRRAPGDRVRWAVIGQGYFAQAVVLPAFGNARSKPELVALLSGDEKKRRLLGRKYKVEHALPYEDYDELLASGTVDAVYIALPNHLHKDYTVRAAEAGVHVLCEKPMAVTETDCLEMIGACKSARVKLMIAYRLHLEAANLSAIETVRRGKIGDPRYFSSIFSLPVKAGNIRTNPTELGGGPLFDIGIYCINAARYLFRSEPTEVTALTATRPSDRRFTKTHEQAGAVLRFPDERLACFTSCFSGADLSSYQVVGTKGFLRLEPAYEHSEPLTLETSIGRRSTRKTFRKRDQIAPELDYFAGCINEDREPEPSGWEGLHDVKIIQAILQSAREGRSVRLNLEDRRQRPGLGQELDRPSHRAPPLVEAEPPSLGE